jgi:hypothetical protein
MRALRCHIAARLVACFLLTWAAADLLVPSVCSEEEYSQASGSAPAQDHDDCFCCCFHTEDPLPLVAVLTPRASMVHHDFRPADLAPGVPRALYHPPLFA